MLKKSLKNISIKDMYYSGELSTRAINCCLMEDLPTLYDVVTYFETGGSFLKLTHAGRVTANELEKLCLKTLSRLKDSNEKIVEINDKIEQKELTEDDFHRLISKKLISSTELLNFLSPVQKNILVKKYDELISSCSNRTAKWLRVVDFDYFVHNYLLEHDNRLRNIRNLGNKSFPELVELKKRLEKEIFNTMHLTEEIFSREKLILEKGKWIEDDFVYHYYTQYGHMPMFYIFERELKSNPSRDMDIFFQSYPIFENDTPLSSTVLGVKYKISSSRIIQIKNKIFKDFFSTSNPLIKEMKENWFFYIKLINDKDILWQDDDRISRIIEQENIHFNREFILQILAIVSENTHTLLGDFESEEKNTIWKNKILIPGEVALAFNFNKFVTDIEYIISIRQTEILSDIESYILRSPAWKKYKSEIMEEVMRITRDILKHEFGLSIVSGKITISTPTFSMLPPSDVLYGILKQNGEPMHIDNIFIEFKKKFPKHKYNNPAQLRPLLYQHDLITHRGRKSTYMLKEWEHIKSGTIRDTIIEFLDKQENPQRIEAISNYVLQFFPETNMKSIRTTLYSDHKKRFIRSKGGYFSLYNKTYNDGTIETVTKNISNNEFKQTLANLEKFIWKNWHFPFPDSTNPDEISLYTWWRTQNLNLDQLTEKQKEEIEEIRNQYKGIDTERDDYEWNNKYNSLINFVANHKRIPSDNSRGIEKLLRNWHIKITNDMVNKRLNESQLRKYTKIKEIAKQ